MTLWLTPDLNASLLWVKPACRRPFLKRAPTATICGSGHTTKVPSQLRRKGSLST